MTSVKFLRNIKNYAVISFLIPLITLNICLLIYKFLGSTNLQLYPNLNWSAQEHSYDFKKYQNLINSRDTNSFTNCPKYQQFITYYTASNVISSTKENENLIRSLTNENKIIKITYFSTEKLNVNCVKNHKIINKILKNFSFLENIFIKTIIRNPASFAEIQNPYFYGEVSISRTARYFPANWIFKPLIILSAFFLFLYWKNNFHLFNELKNNNIINEYSKKFFYYGLFSCIFLVLHAAFLGLDIDSKIFTKFRRLIIILFIASEITAQILLTKTLFQSRKVLENYIKPSVLKIKVFFVILVFFITIASFVFLIFGNPTSAFKHILEWNYFSFLLLYYFLSRLLWK